MEILEKEIHFFLKAPFLFLCMLFALIVLFRFRKELDQKGKWVGLIVLVYMFTSLLGGQLALFNIYSSWLYNIMYVPLSLFIWKLFKSDNKGLKFHKRVNMVFLIICLLHFINLLFFQGIIYIATATMLLFQLFNAILAFFYLKYRLENYDEPVHRNLLNWVAFAVIIDNIVSIPTTALWSKEMYELIGAEQFYLLNKIQSFLYSCWYLIIAAGILWNTTSLSSRFSSSSS